MTDRDGLDLPISLQLLLSAVQTELQHFAFQVRLLHTLRAVLLTIVSKVTAKSWKMLGWLARWLVLPFLETNQLFGSVLSELGLKPRLISV